MRTRGRLPSRKFWMMRIVTCRAGFAINRAHITLPVTTGAAMHTRVPITISGSVTTTAKSGAVRNLQLLPVPSLQSVEFVFVMAIKANVIAPVPAMAHHDVLVFIRNDDVAVL